MGFYPYNPYFGQRIQGETGTEPVDMAFLAHYQEAPAAVSTSAVHAAITLTASPQTITTNITNPDVPRILSITGNQAGEAGNVVITGKDAAGATISDTIALNGTTTVEGAKAFKTVTSIQVPALTNSDDTVAIGWTKKLGLPHKIYNASCLLVKLFNGSTDSGTLTVNSSNLCQNYFALNGTPDGTKVVDLFYIV